MNKWYIAAALLTFYVYSQRRPKWLDDVLMRSYSKDYLVNGEEYPEAASAAAEYGLPTQWVIHLQKNGMSKALLEKGADSIIGVLLKKGPPKDSMPLTLQIYKAAVLGEVV